LARLKRHAQRHAIAQQVLLAYDFAQHAGAQAFGKRNVSGSQGSGFLKCAGSVAI
jgi:hypothetical protein